MTDCSTMASLSTITPGERIEFPTVPSLMMQPSDTIEFGIFPPRTHLVGGRGLENVLKGHLLSVEVKEGVYTHKVHTCFVIRIDGADILPVG